MNFLYIDKQKYQFCSQVLISEKAMIGFTVQQIEQLRKLKGLSEASQTDDSQNQNIKVIMNIKDDVLHKIKQKQNVFAFDLNKMMNSKMTGKRSMLLKKQKAYQTERHSPLKDEQAFYTQSHQQPDSFSQVNYNDSKQYVHKMLFFQQGLQKSQYVPIDKNRLNPQKVHQHQISSMNSSKVTEQKQKPKTIKPLSKKPVTPSPTLMSPIKNLKKHVIKNLEQKRQQEQIQLQTLLQHSRSKMQLGQFYKKNDKHIPVYEKSKILKAKKQQKLQSAVKAKEFEELYEVTFQPQIDRKTVQIVQGTSFQDRLQYFETKKDENQERIIYETLKPFSFKPKLNDNSLVESRVKKIWDQSDKNSKKLSKSQQQSHQQLNQITQTGQKEETDFFTIKLGSKFAQQLFID